MFTKRLGILVMLVVIGCQQVGIVAQNKAAETTNQSTIDPQLKIFKDVLLNEGSSEEMRINAASLMLQRQDPMARQILLEILNKPENLTAQISICRSLTQVSTEKINNRSDFIQPLLGLLETDDTNLAKVASEATLIFQYDEISDYIEKIVTDTSKPVKVRLNTIQVFKRPDIGAITKLMEMLDNPDQSIVLAAENTLVSLSIPVSKDPEVRKQIINGIRRLGKEEFLRNWQVRQQREQKMLQLQADYELLQKLHEKTLNEIYDMKNDAEKVEYLVTQLESQLDFIKLWVLKMIYAENLKSGKSLKLPPEVGARLLDLIADENKNIRLRTAQVLSLMRELDSAQKLLDQINIEQDPEVKTELFVTLSWVCFNASAENSPVRITPDIRLQTLQLAEKYLNSEDQKAAQKGGDVIKKLLEHNGSKELEDKVNYYLELLVKRYKAEVTKPDAKLRGELLSNMASMCNLSIYKTQAITLFKPIFITSLKDQDNFTRESAVDGLIYIDKTEAFKILREQFINDESPRIRSKIVELADEVGGKEDLEWLAKKVGNSTESDIAWQAMLRIFNDCDASFLEKWLTKFNNGTMQGKILDDQMVSFIEIAFKKAVSEKLPELTKKTNLQLADLYLKTAKYQQAAKIFGEMVRKADTDEEKNDLSAKLLDTYFKWGNLEQASHLISISLASEDLGPERYEVQIIDKHLNNPSNGNSEMILQELVKIKTDQPRPEWEKQLQLWTQKFKKIPIRDPNSPPLTITQTS
ncbi:MAG: HEAT repeat domain-containing protein [Planctomycetota bacterium]|jgi:HEAT repeat protein